MERLVAARMPEMKGGCGSRSDPAQGGDVVVVVVDVEVVVVVVVGAVVVGDVVAVVVDVGGRLVVVVGAGDSAGTLGAVGAGIGKLQSAAAQSVGVTAITT